MVTVGLPKAKNAKRRHGWLPRRHNLLKFVRTVVCYVSERKTDIFRSDLYFQTSMEYVDPAGSIEKNMDWRNLLSLGRSALLDLKSAMMTIWSNGPTVQFTAISVNGAPFQFRTPPILVSPNHPALICVTLILPENSFQPGKNEICFLTPDRQECFFLVTL